LRHLLSFPTRRSSDLVGYETSGSYPLSPTSTTVFVNDLRINGATSFGTFIGYSLTSNSQFEFLWDRNLTSYSLQPTPGAPYTKRSEEHTSELQSRVDL